MTPIQWGPSPPEPESYSATSTGTPAPLSPDVAELVRRVRQVDYAEDAGGYLLKDEVNQLADACERLTQDLTDLPPNATAKIEGDIIHIDVKHDDGSGIGYTGPVSSLARTLARHLVSDAKSVDESIAADEKCERLAAENAKLRAALEPLAKLACHDWFMRHCGGMDIGRMNFDTGIGMEEVKAARAALKETTK